MNPERAGLLKKPAAPGVTATQNTFAGTPL
jgi:hypothetical protein